MEEAFANLQKEGKADVENLVKWIKESKVIDTSKAQEDRTRSFFNDAPDNTNVTLDQFKEILNKLAAELKTNFDAIAKKLSENVPQALQDAISGAANTLTGVLKLG